MDVEWYETVAEGVALAQNHISWWLSGEPMPLLPLSIHKDAGL